MDVKKLKFMQLFAEFSKITVLNEKELTVKLEPILKLDYTYALDVWEYMTQNYELSFSKNKALSEFFGNKCLELFFDKSPQRTTKVVMDSQWIGRFVFSYNPSANKDIAQLLVAQALMTSKYAFAEYALNLVSKNPHFTFASYLKIIVSYCLQEIIEQCTKERKKIAMPKKLTEVLLNMVAKLKGPDKALLAQRIKEVN